MGDSPETFGDRGRLESLSEAELGVLDDLVRRMKSFVRARAVLVDRGGSVAVIRARTAEIERLRTELADHVRETAA